MWYALNFVMFDQPSKIQIRSCINIERSIGSASNQIVLDSHCFKDVSRVLTSRFGDESPVGEFDPEPV